jgi:ABC-type sugar transport system substrate-binding protein
MLIQAGLAAGSAACTGGAMLSAAEHARPQRLQEIGIIGGVPKDMKGDWKTSLRRIAEIG